MQYRTLLKYQHREYRPWYIFYLPIYVYWIILSIKAGHPIFFSASNPGMTLGGFYGYSKRDILKQLDPKLIPTTIHISHEVSYAQLTSLIDDRQIGYPLIIKPNKSNRGTGVYKINSPEELDQKMQGGYGSQYHGDFLIQSYIDLPWEFGVMYYRIPGEKRGNISGIVQKGLLGIVGNGVDTVQQLINSHPRARYYHESIAKHYHGSLQDIPSNNEQITLVSIGNHCKGTTFYDASYLINDKLVQTFDRIADQISGFYFGRFDLRTASVDDLYAGKVQIMEVNGAESEPAHIYDPQNSLWGAYLSLLKHWRILYTISDTNHRAGHPYTSIRQTYNIFTTKK